MDDEDELDDELWTSLKFDFGHVFKRASGPRQTSLMELFAKIVKDSNFFDILKIQQARENSLIEVGH